MPQRRASQRMHSSRNRSLAHYSSGARARPVAGVRRCLVHAGGRACSHAYSTACSPSFYSRLHLSGIRSGHRCRGGPGFGRDRLDGLPWHLRPRDARRQPVALGPVLAGHEVEPAINDAGIGLPVGHARSTTSTWRSGIPPRAARPTGTRRAASNRSAGKGRPRSTPDRLAQGLNMPIMYTLSDEMSTAMLKADGTLDYAEIARAWTLHIKPRSTPASTSGGSRSGTRAISSRRKGSSTRLWPHQRWKQRQQQVHRHLESADRATTTTSSCGTRSTPRSRPSSPTSRSGRIPRAWARS